MGSPSVLRYAVGVACLLVIAGGYGYAAVWIRRRTLSSLDGATAVMGDIVLALALLIIQAELLGTVWLLRAPALVVAALLSAVAAARWLRAPGWSAPTRLRRTPPVDAWALGLALLAAGALLAQWLVATLHAYAAGMYWNDTLWYHGPIVATFVQTGSTTGLVYTDIEQLTRFYPMSAELLHAVGVISLGYDTLSPGSNIIWLGLMLLAGYCVGRSRGLGPWSMVATAAVLATPMLEIVMPGTMDNDLTATFFLLAAVALIVDLPVGVALPGAGPEAAATAAADAAWARIALAGLAVGLSISVKLTVLPAAGLLTLGIIAITPRGRRLRDTGIWIGAMLVGCGYWLIRNLIAIGTPLPGTNLPLFSKAPSTLDENINFPVSHYFSNAAIMNHFFKELGRGLDRYWAWLLGVALIGVLLLLFNRRDKRLRMLAAVALVTVLVYVITPETAEGPVGNPWSFIWNLRYVFPGLVIALTLTPLAPLLGGSWPRRVTLAVLLALFALLMVGGDNWPAHHRAEAIWVASSVTALALAALLVRCRAWLGGRAWLGVGCATLLACVVAGYFGERFYIQNRYTSRPHVYEPIHNAMTNVYVYFQKVRNARVAITGSQGSELTYPLYGQQLTNRVRYVARVTPAGAVVEYRTCASWRTAVNAGHFRYLVVTPGSTGDHQSNRSAAAWWVWNGPHSRLVMRYVSNNGHYEIWRLSGPLPPSGCKRVPRKLRTIRAIHPWPS